MTTSRLLLAAVLLAAIAGCKIGGEETRTGADAACVQVSAACTQSSDCCSYGCVSGVCVANPIEGGSCRTTNDCASLRLCKSGACTTPTVSMCRDEADVCSSYSQCCTGNCEGGFCTQNQPPVARAGLADVPNVPYTQLYTLTNTSSDPDGDPLSYGWSFTTMPAGSTAALSSTTAAIPSFTPDKTGDYGVRLVVTDGPTGAPNRYTVETSVTIHVVNREPQPAATASGASCKTVGADLSCSRNNPVHVAATATDVDGDALECAWRVTEPGATTPTVLADFTACGNPSSASRDYTPSGEGTYVVEYVVRDHDRTSGAVVHTVAAQATFVARNDPPVPVLSRPIYYGNVGPAGGTTPPVTLDASASTDPNLDHLDAPPLGLSYVWQMLSASDGGALPPLSNADTAIPSFVPPRVAEYVLELRVSDPARFGRAAASTTVQVTVHVDRYVKELGHDVADAARAQDVDRFVLVGKDPADPTKGKIWTVDGGVEGAGLRLVDPADGTSSGIPRLVDVTRDGTRAIVVDENVSIWLVNLGTGTMQRVTRPFAIRDVVAAGNKYAYLFGSGTYDTARELDVTSGAIGIPGSWPGYGWFGTAFHDPASGNANQIYRVDGSSHYWYRTQLNSGSGATGYDVSKAAPDCGGYPLTYATAVWATQNPTFANAYVISSCGRVYRADTLESLGTSLGVSPSHVDSTSTGAVLVTEGGQLRRFTATLDAAGTDPLPVWSLNGAGLTATATKAFFDLAGNKRYAIVHDTATPVRYGIVTFP